MTQGHRDGVPRANDTSFAAVSVPRSALEDVVYRLEHYLNSAPYRGEVPIGRDIKVMGARHDSEVVVTVAVPVLARKVHDRTTYDQVIERVRIDALALVRDVFGERHDGQSQPSRHPRFPISHAHRDLSRGGR